MVERLRIEVSGPREGGSLGAGGEAPWATYTDERRAGIVTLVRDTLTDLLASVEEWVPTALQVMDDNGFELRLVWQFAAVDHEILRIRAEAAADEQQRIDELRQALHHGT